MTEQKPVDDLEDDAPDVPNDEVKDAAAETGQAVKDKDLSVSVEHTQTTTVESKPKETDA